MYLHILSESLICAENYEYEKGAKLKILLTIFRKLYCHVLSDQTQSLDLLLNLLNTYYL